MFRDFLELILRRMARLGGIRLLVALRQPWLAGLIRRLAALWPTPPDRRPPIRAVATTQAWFANNPAAGLSCRVLIPPQVHERVLPRTVGEPVHWKFRERVKHLSPETYLATLRNGSVVGRAGAVMTSDRTLLGDVSLEWYMPPERHSLLFRPRLPKLEPLAGVTANLALASGDAYYHWLVDVLPRVELLRRAGVSLAEIDHFILNGGGAPFQRETLGLLGIDAARCLSTGPARHYRAETLLVPSRCGASGNPPRWVADFLRASFSNTEGASAKSDRIYISRRTAKYRRLLNEDEALTRLKDCGFREVAVETMSFREQVDLFAGAEAVAAPHGGGLTNIVFCQPGTKILEFFSPHYVNECFWAMGNLVGLEHYYLLGEGRRPPEGCDRQWGEWNIKLDPRKLDDLLRLAGLD